MKTSLCFFRKNVDEYTLEEQVKSIIECTDDEVSLIYEDELFTPKSADRLIEQAIQNKSEKLIFLAEEENSNNLYNALLEEYGDKFKEIEVIDELFLRYTEDDNNQNQQKQNANNQNNTQKQQIKENPKLESIKGYSMHIFISDASFPQVGLINKFVNDISKFENQIKNEKAPNKKAAVFADYNEQKGIFVRSQVLPELWKSFPSQEKDLIDKIFVGKYIEVPQGKVESQTDIDALVNNLFLRGATKVTLYGHNIAKPSNQNVTVIPIESSANPNNNEIYKCIEELKKGVVKQNKKTEKEIAETWKKESEFVKYIKNLIEAIKNYEKTKSRHYSDETIKSEFLDAIKEFLLTDVKSFEDEAKQAGLGGVINIAKGGLKDLSSVGKNNKDNDKNENQEQENEDEKLNEDLDDTARYIITYEKYDLLKQLSGLK